MKILYNKKQTAEKKSLINRISELTGVKPKYLGAPSMLYQIGLYQVDRDGNLIAPDDQDAMDLVAALKLYGFEETARAGETTEEAGEPVAEQEDVQESVAEEPLDEAQTAEVTEETTEEALTEAPIEEATMEIIEAEPAEDVTSPSTAEDTPIALSIAFPLHQHTGQSIRNLVNLIYSRGSLVSKAVQGEFFAPQELADALGNKNAISAEEAIKRIREFEDENELTMKGIRFEEGKLIFIGFPETSDADTLLAFQQLAEKMNKQAISQKRIQAKAVDEENEKYSMRTWLIRIGMDGNKYKKTRNILMEHLKGHTAFRTPADAERWKARQAELKAERKAAQEEAAS